MINNHFQINGSIIFILILPRQLIHNTEYDLYTREEEFAVAKILNSEISTSDSCIKKKNNNHNNNKILQF